jgi:Endosomal/lysosomal potassium channel TMEM175
LDRIVNFSVAVFAIAITLLIPDIRVPEIPDDLVAEALPAQLLALWPKYFGYVLGFVVIISFWNIHHSIFSAIRGYDRGLIWLNSLFLMFVALEDSLFLLAPAEVEVSSNEGSKTSGKEFPAQQRTGLYGGLGYRCRASGHCPGSS